MVTTPENLTEGLLREMDRCRELARQYESIGPAGWFGRANIVASIKAAEGAIASGDAVEMLRCYERLQGHE